MPYLSPAVTRNSSPTFPMKSPYVRRLTPNVLASGMTPRPFGLVHGRIVLTMHSHITTNRIEPSDRCEVGARRAHASSTVHAPDTPIDIVGFGEKYCAIVAYVADVLLELAVGCKGTVPKNAVGPKHPLWSCGVVPR